MTLENLDEQLEFDSWYMEQYQRNYLNTQSTYQKEITKILRNRNKTFLRNLRNASFRSMVLQKIARLLGDA